MSAALPYPGLRPFRRDETDVFFGREEQVDELLAILDRRRFLAVVGPSGCGKSSLVRAGMIAGLESGWMASAGVRWRIAEMRPGAAPLRRLATALVDAAALGPERGSTPKAAAFLGATLRRGPLGLVEALRETALPAGTSLLLLVDQFEEIFRLHRLRGRDQADAFVALLLETAAQSAVPVYVVITMRSDFLGDSARFAGLPEAMNASQYLTPRLTRDQRRAAIVGPARVFDGDVEPALVNHLLNAMGPDPDQLPLLQHLLMRMWTRAGAATLTPAGGRRLTLHDLETVGGLRDALSIHADKAFAELDPAGRRIAEALFRALCERSGGRRDTRRPVALGEVAAIAEVDPAAVAAVVETFRRPNRNFLTPPHGEPLTPASVLDVSHESLIRCWRRLGDWVESEARSAETYGFLEQTARRRRAGEAALWGTPDLENARAWKERERPNAAWAARYGSDFELAMAFLDASEDERRRRDEAAEADRRRELANARALAAAERRAKRGLIALLLLSFAILGGVIWAWTRADRNRRVADSRRLALYAENLRESEPDLALLAAVEGLRRADTLEARRGLFGALQRAPRLARVLPLPEGESRDVTLFAPALSRDGKWLAAPGPDGALRVWDVEAGRVAGVAGAEAGGEVKAVAFSDDGTLAVARGDLVELWDVAAGHRIGEPLRGHARDVTTLAWSAGGGWLASGGQLGAVVLWDVAARDPLPDFPHGHDYAVTALALSPDVARLASADRTGKLLLWDLAASPPVPEELDAASAGGEIAQLVFSPRGDRLVAVGAGGEGLAWDVATRQADVVTPWRGGAFAFDPESSELVVSRGRLVERRREGEEPRTTSLAVAEVARAVFSPGASWLATERPDGSFLVWDLADQPPGERFAVPGVSLRRAAFSPDGSLLAAGGGDGAVYWWPVTGDERQGEALAGHAAGHTNRHADSVNGVAFSPDGTRLVSVGADRTLRIWDVGRGQGGGEPREGGLEPLASVAWSPDGRRVAVAVGAGSGPGAVRLWDPASQTFTRDLDGDGDARSVAWSPDGRRLAAAWSGAPGVVVWEAATGEKMPFADPPAPDFRAVAFSHGGEWLAAAGRDGDLALWEGTTGRRRELARRRESGRGDVVEALAFSPDDRLLATGHRDGAVVLWQLGAGKLHEIGAFRERGKRVDSLAWRLGGRLLAAAGADGTVRLWDADVGSWCRRACEVANRALTEEEWKRFFPDSERAGTTCAETP